MVFGLTSQELEPHSRLECFTLHQLFDRGFSVLNVIYNNYIVHVHVVIHLCYIYIVCGVFEWKWICTGFFQRLLIYVLPFEIQLSRRQDWDPINRFNPATCLCLFQARNLISNAICRGLFFVCSVSYGERWLLALLILVVLFAITVHTVFSKICIHFLIGAYYYYNPEAGKTFDQTLKDVYDYAKREKIPYR